MTKYFKPTIAAILLVLVTFVSSCVKKDFDKPPVGTLPIGEVYTISQLRQMYADSGAMMINYDASVYAIVTMDESSGNIYKSAYIQDGGDAVNLHKTASGGLRIGDSIRVYLKNVVLSEYGGMFQLDNVNPDSNIVILGNQKYLKPEVITMTELLTGNYQGKLIKLDSVQFNSGALGKTYADPDGSANRTLENCHNKSVDVRTSNYATFAETLVAEGNGELTAIAGVYNGSVQIYIRSLSEVNLTGDRCDGGGGGGGGEVPIGQVYTISQLRQMYADSGAITISYDASVYAVVTMDESTGNIYKSAYIQDGTGAVNLHKTATSDLSIGDSIRVYLKNLILSDYGGMFQLDNVDPAANIIVIDYQKFIQPETVTLTDLLTGNYQGQLITVNNVQFSNDELGKSYADAGASANRTLEDCDGKHVVVRTSNYATFANTLVATGNGDFTGITGVYNNAIQLYIRSLSELDLTGERCGGGGGGGEITPVTSVDENFDGATDYENIDFEGWTNQIVAGTRAWTGKTFDNNKYAQATGYNSGLPDMETWLITPPVINNSGDLKLTFNSAIAYWTHTGNDIPVTIWASTDYDGTNFETANWVEITSQAILPDASSSNYSWIESGEISLADFTGNVAIAFKYKGSDTESTSFQLDNVTISSAGGGGGGDVLASLNETFDDAVDYDPIDFNGWVDEIVSGDRAWIGKTFSGNKYAQATGYNSGLDAMETWMVTPLVDNNAGDKTLSFKTAMAYWAHTSGDPLTVYVSTDYDGSNVSTASWTQLSPTLPTSSSTNYEWIESGSVDLSAYSGNVAVAFKYVGSDTESTSIQIDDVVIE